MSVFQLRSLGLALVALTLGYVVAVPSLMGQRFGQMISNRSGSFIAPPRQLSQVLKRAQTAIDEGQYSEAVVELGELLAGAPGRAEQNELPPQDFFLETENVSIGKPAGISLLRTARQMVGALPAKGIEDYELRYGAVARRQLTVAAEQRDWSLVADVRRQYFHTLAGYEASLLLAQREIYAGRVVAASLLLDEVSNNPRAVSHLGNQVYTLHAAACLLAGRSLPDLSAVTTSELAWTWQGFGGATDAAKTEIFQANSPEDVSKWLKSKLPPTLRFQPPAPADYRMLGGSPSRDGDRFAQMPMSTVSWKKLTTETSPLEQKRVRQLKDELITSGQLPPPSWTPLKVGDQVLMRTTKHLWGVDYHTGKVVWRFPIEDVAVPGNEEDVRQSDFDPQDQLSEQLRQRVWNDLPYGQVTSDGDRAFVLDDLSMVIEGRLHPNMRRRGFRPANTRTNTLSAVELATEGKLLWQIGQADPQGPFADTFFLGPPLPVDGLLYVVAEISGDIHLLCLDPVDGSERWRQQLVAIESGEIDVDPIRRIAGSIPTYHEGVLICPTGAGTVVAVDLVDRTLRWGATFSRDSPKSKSSRQSSIQSTTDYLHRWHNGIAHASGTRVIITPPETNWLLGLDLLSGKYLFPARNRLNMRYLAGIHEDRFIVAGLTRVRAFDLKSGAPLWASPSDMLSSGHQIAGIGAFSDRDFLVPVTSNELIRLSLADGSIQQRRSTEYAMGNLTPVGGDLLIQGPDSLTAAFGEASLNAKVEQLLAENPNDLKALVQKADLLLQKNQSQAALDILNKVRQLAPENDAAIKLSISAMLGLLRDRPELGEQYVGTLEQLIDLPDARVELLSLRVKGAMKSACWVEATEHLIRLSAMLMNEKLDPSVSSNLLDSPARFCSIDSWIAARMHEIRKTAPPEDRRTINDRLGKAIDQVMDRPTRQLRMLGQHFEAWQASERLTNELVQRYIVDNDFLSAERVLMGSHLSPLASRDTQSVDRLVLLAGFYHAAGRQSDAALAAKAAVALKTDEKPLKPAQQAVLDEILSAVNAQPPTVWNKQAKIEWQQTGSRATVRSNGNQNPRTTVLSGQHFDGWRLMADKGVALEIRDQRGSRYPISLAGQRTGQRQAWISGSLLLVMLSDRMACVDLNQLAKGVRDSVLWSTNLNSETGDLVQNRPVTNPFGDRELRQILTSDASFNTTPELKVGPVLGDRVLILRGGDLLAINLQTSKVMWRNSMAPKNGEVVCSGNQVAVVSADAKEVAFFDLHDGRKQKSIPWTHGRTWASIGSRVLSYVLPSGNEFKYKIRLVDPFDDRILLSQDSLKTERGRTNVPSAGGVVVDGRYLAWLQSDGQSLIWDLMEGQELARLTLPTFDDLQEVRAMRLGQRILLLPKRKPDPKASAAPNGIVAGSNTSHRAISALFAIGLDDGQLQWQKQFDKIWGCSLDQSSGTPVLMLTRSYTQKKISPAPSRKFLDFLALDLETGDEVTKQLAHPIALNDTDLRTRIVVQEANKNLIVTIGGKQLTMNFSPKNPEFEAPVVAEPLPSQ